MNAREVQDWTRAYANPMPSASPAADVLRGPQPVGCGCSTPHVTLGTFWRNDPSKVVERITHMKTSALRMAKLVSKRRDVLRARVGRYKAQADALSKQITEMQTEIKELDAIIHRHLLDAETKPAAEPVKLDPIQAKQEYFRQFPADEYRKLEGPEKDKFDWEYYRHMGHRPNVDDMRTVPDPV